MDDKRPAGIIIIGLLFLFIAAASVFKLYNLFLYCLLYGFNRYLFYRLILCSINIIVGSLVLMRKEIGRKLALAVSIIEMIRSVAAFFIFIFLPFVMHGSSGGRVVYLNIKGNAIYMMQSALFAVLYFMIFFYLTRADVKRRFR